MPQNSPIKCVCILFILLYLVEKLISKDYLTSHPNRHNSVMWFSRALHFSTRSFDFRDCNARAGCNFAPVRAHKRGIRDSGNGRWVMWHSVLGKGTAIFFLERFEITKLDQVSQINLFLRYSKCRLKVMYIFNRYSYIDQWHLKIILPMLILWESWNIFYIIKKILKMCFIFVLFYFP